MRGLIVEVLILNRRGNIIHFNKSGQADRIPLYIQGTYNIAYGQNFLLVRTSFLVAEGLSL